MESRITLIENTGIQFITRKLSIQSCADCNLLFYEYYSFIDFIWELEYAFQLEYSNKIVRFADLLMCGYVDAKGGLTVSESQVLANPNISIIHDGNLQPWPNDLFKVKWGNLYCMADKFYNQWIPVPFLRCDQRNDKSDSVPNYWCRCKIIPDKEQPLDGSLTATILFAFDTNSLFQNDDSEYPGFGCEDQKTYRFCNTANGRLRFCSNDIIENLMELAHGVRCLQDIPATQPHKYDFLASYLWLLEYIADNVDLPEMTFIPDQGQEKVPVEMVIDVGNSKTAAILFENHDMNDSEPLALQNFTDPVKPDGSLNRSQQPFDMRVAFQRADFGMELSRFSKQFIWPSMVRLGDEALKLTYQASNQGQNDECLSTYSSPKRYLWDDKAMKEEWQCVKIGANGKNEKPYIDGISNWFHEDGEIGDGEKSHFNLFDGYHYSRKTLMTLAFMEIIAQATMQTNSNDYRKNKRNTNTARFIDTVVLSCPTGMSTAERKLLYKCLEDAFYVLEKFYKSQGSKFTTHQIRIVPDLNPFVDEPQWMFDEATSTQFVYLYAEIAKRYQNHCSEFFRRYGKRRGNCDSMIIGSLDIGAGMSNISICQYDCNENNQSGLHPVPLFWDSFDKAGDDVMRVLIVNVLLQGDDSVLEQELLRRGWEVNRIRSVVHEFVGSDESHRSPKDKRLCRDFTLQVLVPIINKYLELLDEKKNSCEIRYHEIFSDMEPNKDVSDKFSDRFGFSLKEMKWKYDVEILSKHIIRSMEGLLRKVSYIFISYECDMILLSGHPTSLPPIRDVFLKHLPVSPNRLLFMNKFRIGNGLPLINQYGYPIDSKSIVLLGAMIGYLSSTSGLDGFSLDLSTLGKQMKPVTDYFVLLNDNMEPCESCFITPKKNYGEIMIDSFPKYIGSKHIGSPSYPTRPFYILDINEKEITKRIKHERQLCGFDDKSEQEIRLLYKQQRDNILKSCPLRFVIERPNYVEDKECLRIYSVEDSNFNLLPSNNFVLSPYSLKDTDCYWLDSGIFNL